MLTELFATLDPWDGEGRLDGSGGPAGPTGDTGEPDLAQQPVTARRRRVCPCCHGSGEHASGFECYRCDSSGSLEGDDPGPGGCDGEGGSSMSATAGTDGGTVRQVPPEEYRKFQLHDYPTARTLPALVRHFKQIDGPYYAKVKADVQANGFTTPALVKFKDPRGNPLKKPVLWEGHHRAAVAHELGMHLPVADYDDAPAAEAAHRSNAEWFSKDPRAEHTAGANGDLPQGLIFEHREYPRSYEHRITARHPDLPDHPGFGRNYAGHITWFGDDPSEGGNREVSSIEVHPSLQRRGLATELFNRAKEITPDIHHSDTRTSDGRAWSATTAGISLQVKDLPEPSGHPVGESSYEEDDGYMKDYWDKEHPRLNRTMHRHLAVPMTGQHPAHDNRLPLADQARAVMDTVGRGQFGGNRIGYHWTDDPNYNHMSTGTRLEPGDTHVIVHAHTPPREHIEDNDWVLQDRGVRDHSDPEREVPLKSNAPVHVTGVSWKSVGGWKHHNFEVPMRHRAVALPRPALPPEQEEALGAPGHSEYRRKTLELAKNPVAGTHIWRSEHRAEPPAEGARSSGVGMHWTVNPDSVVGGHAPEGHKTVVWHGELEHPDQAIPRDHPVWSGSHMSMDHEAEVRLRPGSKVKLHGAYTWDGEGAPEGVPVVRNPAATAKGWNYHPIGEHAEVSGPRGHIDYSGFDLDGGGRSASTTPHWGHPDAVATGMHEMHAGNMYQEHHGDKDPFDDVDWDGPEDDYRSHSNGIMVNNVVHDGWSKPEELSEDDHKDWLRWHPDRAGIEQRHGIGKTAVALPSPFLERHGRTVQADDDGHPNTEMVPTAELGRYATQETTGEHAKEVARHVLEKGSMTPLILQYHPGSGSAYLGEGNHRLRAANTLGITHVPVRVTRNAFGLSGEGAPVPQPHPAQARGEHVPADIRPSDLGFSGTPLSGPIRSTAAQTHAADDEHNIHRGLTTVLPPDVHTFVHDPAQPVAARAHMLLAHVRKAKPEINSEEAHGTTGGLGNFWSPMKHKAAEYADQAGWDAYRDHEREHHCGGEDTVSGGCPTTNVVIHAGEPHEKHQWKEEFRPGERYDRDISWRLPVRPGAPLHVKGISWREGNDNEPIDYSKSIAERDKRGPYTEHDFPSPVHKRAGTTSVPESSAGWSDNEIPSGTRGRDHHGHEVEMTAQNGWAHLDGSYGEEGPTGLETVSDHPVTPYEHVHTWLPDKRYWGPNSGHNDQRLFDGSELRPEIRADIMHRVGTYLRRYEHWQRWARVYFAGSEAAQWEPFNGDFDVIVGIDWPRFFADNPKEAGHSPQELAEHMTDGMWHSINAKKFYFTLADGERVGPFDRTFFVNPNAWDIRALHPYAAYDVTRGTWAVEPLQVPKDWSAKSLPESYWTYAEAMAKAVEAIGTLPAEERHRMAANLWEEIHTHRSDAFADGGKGLYDLANVVEKYLDQHPGGLWSKLTQWKNHAPSGAQPWVPTTGGLRERVSALLRLGEVRHDPQGHTGVMVALVPPRKVARELAQEGGEPVESLHVTLAYLGNKAEYTKEQLKALPDLVKGWAHGRKPLKASVGGVGTFVNPDEHVLWAAVDIPHGTVFRDDLVRHLEGHGYNIRHDHGWTPHMTLAYSSTHVRFLPKITPRTWEETEIWVCAGGRWESFPIGG